MNRTLLVEEGDDEGTDNRLDKKKKDKEKLQEIAEKKKKMGFKKADGKREFHHSNSLTSSSKVQPADDLADMAAVNPDAEGVTSPVESPAVIGPVSPTGSKSYQGSIIIPPPPRAATPQQIQPQNLQQRGNWHQQQYQVAGYVMPNQQPQVQLHGQVPPGHFLQSPFQSPGQAPQQIQGQYIPQSYQYSQPGGVPVYGNQVVAGSHHTSVLTRTQSLPPSASHAVEQVRIAGQPTWGAHPPASQPTVNTTETSWANNPTAEPREERSWREGENPSINNGISNTQWTAFSPRDSPGQSEPPIPVVNEVDEEHSSSDEDVDRSSSPELAGEEGEVLLRAPSLASFAESISSIEEESEDNLWRILPEQREYYTKQFRRLQPIEGGVVKGPRARDFFMKSSLPVEVLSKIWHLSDINKDNALNLDEFCIAMHLVVAMRHGLELPSTLPSVLLPVNKETAVSAPVHPLEKVQGTEQEQQKELQNVSSPDHWQRFSDSLGRNAAPSPAKINHDSAVKRKARSLVQPVPHLSDIQGDEDHGAARPRSHSESSSLDDAADGQAVRGDSSPNSPIRPLHIVMPSPHAQQTEVPQTGPTSPSQAVTAEIEIARPRAAVKPSLLDALPGQLLPPPSGKQTRDGWTPTSKFIYQSSPPSSPEDETPTSPLSPGERKTPSPPPTPPRVAEEEEPTKEDASKEVVFRANRRSGERPRSTGDVQTSNQDDCASPTSPGDNESQGSVSSEGRREPPPPPPRKKGHSRSSSLDLNKLFAAKAKENRGTPPSSQSSSHSSQTGDSGHPVKSEPSTPRNGQDNSSSSEAADESEKVQRQEDFADFSRFESFVEAQETVNGEEGKVSSPQPKLHKRSFSLDDSHDVAWSTIPQNAATEVTTTPNKPSHNQEALPRPVPKLKPLSPPTLKQGRRQEKDGEKERKRKTEPPKVVVRPLTKEDKLNAKIGDLREKNAALSKVNSELQEELKSVMERRATLEVKLKQLRSPLS